MSFKSPCGLNIHIGKSEACTLFMLSSQSKPGTTKSVLKAPPVNHPDTSSQYPWDDDDDDDDDLIGQEFDEGADDSFDNNTNDNSNDNNLPNEPRGTSIETPHKAALDFGIRFTKAQYHETKLLKLLSDANAPHFLYKDILNWAQAAKRDNYDFIPERSSRNGQIKYLEKWMHMQDSRPKQFLTALPGPGDQTVETTCFNFTDQLLSLVSDRALFGNLENLDVNNEDRFGKYINATGLLSTINSGQWYHNAYLHEVTDPSKDFVMPIIMACDETNLRKGGKTSSCPLVFTTSILNQKMRNKHIAWRTLGYVNNLSLVESAAETKHNANDDTALKPKRLHAIFKTILASLLEAQKVGALNNIPLQFGDVTKMVNLKVPVSFIIGDIQGGDKICCRTVSYSNTLNRLCRKCNVQGNESGDPLVECQRISMVKIIKLVENNNEDVLKKYNQVNVYTPWFDVSYGGCKFGIFSAACPIEPLHSLENGIILDCLTVLFQDIIKGTKKHAELNAIVKRLIDLPRQRFARAGTQPEMPRLLWKDGVTSLTNLSAGYKVGIMFTIIVVSLQEDGVTYFTKVLGTPQRLKNMRLAFQMLLSYWVWLKRDTYWLRGDKPAKAKARAAISIMLHELSRLWPRLRGQGWEKAKVHEQLHVPDDIERNGAPQGSHTGPTEHNHIRLVKRPAKGTQQRAEVFDKQLGQRISDAYIVDMAYQRMTTQFALPSPLAPTLVPAEILSNQGSTEWVCIEISPEEPPLLHFETGPKRQHHFCAAMIEFLLMHYGALPLTEPLVAGPGGGNVHQRLRIGTEYKRAEIIFRAHADYRQLGPWYDWVMLRWEREDNKNYAQPPECHAGYGDDETIAADHWYAPGQILGFVESAEGAGVRAVVSTCDFSHVKGSVFSTEWKRSYVYERGKPNTHHISLVDVNAIVRHCLMVPHDESQSTYHEIWCQELWGNEFNDCS